jgi:transcriptional regulator with XRE-family HTH domain
MELGKRIKRWRKKREMTLRDLARELNFSAGFFSDIERGKSKPSLDTLEQIAEQLKVPLSRLLSQENAVGDQLMEWRERRELSLWKVAEAVRGEPQELEAWEEGEEPVPLEALETLKETFKTSFSDLLDGMETSSEESAREKILWGVENSDDIPEGMLGLCLDWPELVKELAPFWDVQKTLQKKGITTQKREKEQRMLWELEALRIQQRDDMFVQVATDESMGRAGIFRDTLCLCVPREPQAGSVVFLSFRGTEMLRYYVPSPTGVVFAAASPDYDDLAVSTEEKDLGWYKILGEVVALQGSPRRAW